MRPIVNRESVMFPTKHSIDEAKPKPVLVNDVFKRSKYTEPTTGDDQV